MRVVSLHDTEEDPYKHDEHDEDLGDDASIATHDLVVPALRVIRVQSTQCDRNKQKTFGRQVKGICQQGRRMVRVRQTANLFMQKRYRPQSRVIGALGGNFFASSH